MINSFDILVQKNYLSSFLGIRNDLFMRSKRLIVGATKDISLDLDQLSSSYPFNIIHTP